MSGLFISIEGVEGAGKSTNHQFVCDFLSAAGHTVIATREPGGTVEAEKIRSVLLDSENRLDAATEALLMFAARQEHLQQVIRPALTQGQTVVTDRFVDASYAYQGSGRGLGFDFIAELEALVVGTTVPDVTLYLDLDIEEGRRRVAARGAAPDRIEQEDREFFNRVREGYLQRARSCPERFRIIDASKTLDSVQASLIETLQQMLDSQASGN